MLGQGFTSTSESTSDGLTEEYKICTFVVKKIRPGGTFFVLLFICPDGFPGIIKLTRQSSPAEHRPTVFNSENITAIEDV